MILNVRVFQLWYNNFISGIRKVFLFCTYAYIILFLYVKKFNSRMVLFHCISISFWIYVFSFLLWIKIRNVSLNVLIKIKIQSHRFKKILNSVTRTNHFLSSYVNNYFHRLQNHYGPVNYTFFVKYIPYC